MVQLPKEETVKLNGAQEQNRSKEEERVWRREDLAANWAKSGSFFLGSENQILRSLAPQ